MTGRAKHAQRSKYSYKKKSIPVDMFRRTSTINLIRNTKKEDRPGLIARLLAPFMNKKPRGES